ncbi:MBL fold metallo-hydrolase [Ectothiorhodospiraceae bacterium 2226]|nr:MBL fold metallo-hydrolase [Ectothiorhodospiraceae bacterium 2226]
MIFRQLFEPVSSTYTYLIGCPETGAAALIDPVLETAERDVQVVRELGLTLRYSVDTHIHADHLTGALKLKALVDSRIAAPATDELPCAEIKLREGEPFKVGNVTLHPLFTPGHTDHHHAYLIDTGTHTLVFSGDALLIEACGRSDFQSGDAATLYRSIHDKLFSLPDETLVYPAHDYEGRFITTVAQEKTRNPRLKDDKPLEDFVAIMDGLDLPYPRMIDIAVPANRLCGQCPPELPDELRQACDNLQG